MKNGFVLADEATREGVLIDPGDDVEELLEVIAEQRLTIRYILLTHAHLDHITGVGRAREALGVPVVLHRGRSAALRRHRPAGHRFRLPPGAAAGAGSLLRARRRLPLRPLRSARAPHAGALAGRRLPRGDRAGLGAEDAGRRRHALRRLDGRTDLPGGRHPTLIASIREVLFPFGDDAIVHPGHGPSTTIGEERRSNPFLV